MEPYFTVHADYGVPCLTAYLLPSGGWRDGDSLIGVVGARGTLGSFLASDLHKKGFNVFGIDLTPACSKCEPPDTFATPDAWQTHFSQIFVHLLGGMPGSRGISGLITATRAVGMRPPSRSSDPIVGMVDQLTASFIAPVSAATALMSLNDRQICPSIVFLSSTNANTLSHQSLGYHAANSALTQAAKFLAVEWINRAQVNCVQVGAIHTAPVSEFVSAQSDHFPGVMMKDLASLTEYLLVEKPLGLVGEPLVVSAGRASLDATAVHQNRFGNLSCY